MPTLLIVIGVVIIIIVWFFVTYNGFIKLKNQAAEAWSGIDVQLKRRYDLIPNLVTIVKGYAGHEKSTLESVVEARKLCINASGVKEQGAAENSLTAALGRFFALAEAYPDLKANTNFLELQNALTEVEDQIQYARRYYNAVVRNFNIKCESAPSVIVAGLCGYRIMEYFQAEKSERQNVELSMGGDGNE